MTKNKIVRFVDNYNDLNEGQSGICSTESKFRRTLKKFRKELSEQSLM